MYIPPSILFFQNLLLLLSSYKKNNPGDLKAGACRVKWVLFFECFVFTFSFNFKP